MVFARMRIAAAALGAAFLLSAATSVVAQSGDPKAGPPRTAGTDADAKKDGQRKLNVIAEAAKVLGGPAGQSECVWLGVRVVGRMYHDDLDTAFRHLDLYDRFGCPAGHIPATFRCLLRNAGSIDLKQQELLLSKVDACWINPDLEPTPPASAAAPAGTTNR